MGHITVLQTKIRAVHHQLTALKKKRSRLFSWKRKHKQNKRKAKKKKTRSMEENCMSLLQSIAPQHNGSFQDQDPIGPLELNYEATRRLLRHLLGLLWICCNLHISVKLVKRSNHYKQCSSYVELEWDCVLIHSLKRGIR